MRRRIHACHMTGQGGKVLCQSENEREEKKIRIKK
jgi:hypothetical protein